MTQEGISRRKYITYVGGVVVAAAAAAAGYGIGASTAPAQAPAQTVTQTVTQTVAPPSTPTKIFYAGGEPPEALWIAYIGQAMNAADQAFNAKGIPVEHELISPIEVANLGRVFDEEIAKGFKYMILSSPFLSTIPDFAKKYPDVHFCGSFFAPPGYPDPTANYPLPNESGFESRSDEANYLAGVLAGGITKTNKVGYVNAWDTPSLDTSLNAFVLGAKRENPNVSVYYVIPSEWNDPQKGAASVDALAPKGIDFVVPFGDTMSQGVVAEAEKLGIYCAGYMTDAASQAKFGPTHCLASVWFKATDVMEYIYDQAVQIKKTGKQYPVWHSYGIADGGQDLDLNKDLMHLIPPNVLSDIDQARKDIISGVTKIPWNPTLPAQPT